MAKNTATGNDRRRGARGFTLFELMIVISIIIILVSVALPMLQQHVQTAREATLRHDLHELRRTIDRYAADKGKLPQSLDDLADAQYIREVPIDPITREKNWTLVMGPDPAALEGGEGVKDVRSSAEGTGLDGTAYNTW